MKETPQRVIDDLGRRIAELRHERGLTQRGVADKLGMLIADYQGVERGVRNCTVRTLVHVARALSVPTRELFAAPEFREPRRPGRPPHPKPSLDRVPHDDVAAVVAEGTVPRRNARQSAGARRK